MILDKGVATFFRKTDVTQPGGMPEYTWLPIFRSWYGETSFETSPRYPTEARKEQRTDNKIRVLQCRELKENEDVCVLRELYTWGDVTENDTVYQVGRCYHDSKGPQPFTDVSLEVTRA